jgi:integrase
MGEIRKRGKFYQIRYYRNGQRIEESTGYTRYDEARDLLKKREGAVADGVPLSARSTRLTFDDAVADVVTDYTINGKRSQPDLERRIKLHLLPVFGGRTLNSITAADLRTFAAARLKAGAANGEINRELAVVKRAFNLAAQSERYHGRIPHVSMLAETNVRQGFLDTATVDAVIRHLPAALRPVVRFAYVTGWRKSEVLGLEWRQVDRATWTLRLDPGTTKNKRGRTIDVSAHVELRAALEALWAEHEALAKAGTICPYVFHRTGKRIADYRRAWAVACRAAGAPGRVPHDLRRSAVRNLVRSGIPDTVAMKITGHVTRSVFDRYDITSEADVRDGLARLSSTTGTNGGDKAAQSSGAPAKQSA